MAGPVSAMRWLLAATALLLAGCLGNPVGPAAAGPETVDEEGGGFEEPPAPAPQDEGAYLSWAPAKGARRTVLWLNATLETDAASWFGGTADPDGSLYVDVPEGSRGLVVEIAWQDGLQDLDLDVVAPGWCPPAEGGQAILDEALCQLSDLVAPGGAETGMWRADGGSVGAGDSPLRIALGEEDLARWGCGSGSRGCTWALWVFSDTVILDLDVTWAVTVFVAEDAPADYALLS
jgi:hypothetical protein